MLKNVMEFFLFIYKKNAKRDTGTNRNTPLLSLNLFAVGKCIHEKGINFVFKKVLMSPHLQNMRMNKYVFLIFLLTCLHDLTLMLC